MRVLSRVWAWFTHSSFVTRTSLITSGLQLEYKADDHCCRGEQNPSTIRSSCSWGHVIKSVLHSPVWSITILSPACGQHLLRFCLLLSLVLVKLEGFMFSTLSLWGQWKYQLLEISVSQCKLNDFFFPEAKYPHCRCCEWQEDRRPVCVSQENQVSLCTASYMAPGTSWGFTDSSLSSKTLKIQSFSLAPYWELSGAPEFPGTGLCSLHWADPNRLFIKQDVQMADKHVKRCFT